MSRQASSGAEVLLERLMGEMASRQRPVRVVQKTSFWHQRLADKGLRLVTLGGQDRYLTHYVTTLGHTIYVPDDWDDWPAASRYEILRHELVHVRQFERWSFFGMVIVYGIFPFPMGLAYGRAKLEWEAYAETLRAVAETEGIAAARATELRERIVRRFTGPDYGWMWPFPGMVRRWIAEELDRIEAALS
ncbi:MAG: hypothetical protein R3B70_08670 [Polyangiaceae bacterium]